MKLAWRCLEDVSENLTSSGITFPNARRLTTFNNTGIKLTVTREGHLVHSIFLSPNQANIGTRDSHFQNISPKGTKVSSVNIL